MTYLNEDTLVQQTTADYLQDSLNWESVYAYNQETFGPDGLLGRSSDREVVLTHYLKDALKKFNPNLPETAYDEAVRQVVDYSQSQSMLSSNFDKYKLLKDGVLVSYQGEHGEIKKERLKLFDFNKATNNHFLAVRELWVRGNLYRRRVDIVGFVNGIPLLFVECKNIHKDLKNAYEKNFADYKDTIPHFFHHNAIVMLANGDKAKIGTITAGYEHFHEWKRLSEIDHGVVDMETLLKGVCDKKNFMDIFENFIIYDDSTGKQKKVLAKNNQYLGVNKVIKSLIDPNRVKGKLGVFWHTQGGGKSYSMVFFTTKVHRKIGGNYTFVICTDRGGLDTQIYKTFAGCGVADNDKDPSRPSSGKNLAVLMSQQKSHVFTTIQKFNQEVDPDEGYTRRDDIIVITDEAHRTQYGTLALNMRNALPNANFIGFTGTPLFKDDEITAKVFGDYVSTYDFQRAVEDKVTVPLYYDSRGDTLGVATNDINERIAEKLEEIEIDDIDVSQRLEKELKRDYHIITAEKRLNQIAKDFVDHYSTSWEAGKAMFVCIDKLTCVRMHKLIKQYWDQKIEEIKESWKMASGEEKDQFSKQLAWMEETKMAVIVSEEQGEVEKFRKWGFDITPHRRLIKNGFELSDGTRIDVDSAYKKEEHPFRIAIVCAMWLTGFDVPSLANLYLDKPLKAHTLMQAIARANRVNGDKNNGLIIDYCGILKNLRKALATFTGTGDTGRTGGLGPDELDPTRTKEELLEDLKETIELVSNFLQDYKASLDSIINTSGFERNKAIIVAKEVVNENDETRKKFEVMCREVFIKFKACLTIPDVNDYRDQYSAINIIYKSLQKDRDQADISYIIKQLHEVIDESITVTPDRVRETGKAYDISKINFDRLRAEFEHAKTKNTTVQSLKSVIEKKLQRLIQRNPLRTDFQEHYEAIIDEYNKEKDRQSIEETFEALLKFVEGLDEEENRAVREGLDEETLAIYDLLVKPDLKPKETQKIKGVAKELLKILKNKLKDLYKWQDREPTRDDVKVLIRDFLWNDKIGLPENCYNKNDVVKKTEAVFYHVYRAYPTIPSPYYATV
ncbi:type I restriction endonuclease subunit R [Patescibacteria group bacterium]|nr:type I restriction endonuclease subunit R [Patescibacteria group bacterium]MCG2702172.1 type I restriction endonuclease subunit R [Candidatus Parcubacteria bacterium]MBU4265344.1 type I restriction endonuclease subunit R [Patescibacteria group bacterium]MBU4390784.1 type I restriction endonuclease subunit R [Patescibacteria group bacterium]MBU4397670.1 type I restriction endonuclease subunit R [Patescibacteria group bacterium]